MNIREPRRAFEDALYEGVLTPETKGEYMYMYTDRHRGDAFKHIMTRQYIWNNNIRYKLGDRYDIEEEHSEVEYKTGIKDASAKQQDRNQAD